MNLLDINRGNTMSYEQLSLFPVPLQDRFIAEVKDLKESLDKVRKGQFAKIGTNAKGIKALGERMDIIERGFCTSETSNLNLMFHIEVLQNSYEKMEKMLMSIQEHLSHSAQFASDDCEIYELALH
jgi:hypothetical protein